MEWSGGFDGIMMGRKEWFGVQVESGSEITMDRLEATDGRRVRGYRRKGLCCCRGRQRPLCEAAGQ